MRSRLWEAFFALLFFSSSSLALSLGASYHLFLAHLIFFIAALTLWSFWFAPMLWSSCSHFVWIFWLTLHLQSICLSVTWSGHDSIMPVSPHGICEQMPFFFVCFSSLPLTAHFLTKIIYYQSQVFVFQLDILFQQYIFTSCILEIQNTLKPLGLAHGSPANYFKI